MCTDLLGTQARPEALEFERFGYLRGGQGVVESWWHRAWGLRRSTGADVFEGFIYAWIAFNGWAECVSGEEKDARWVRALSMDSRLQTTFDEWCLGAGAECAANSLNPFASTWPVPKVQDIRRRAPHATIESESTRKAAFFTQNGISFSPQCWLQHRDRGENVPTDWAHFLAALYRVRCNLFHGEKSPYDPADEAIVSAAFRVLVHFLAYCPQFGSVREHGYAVQHR